MISDQLKHIQLSGESEFLQYARFFKLTKHMNLNDYMILRDEVKKRCRILGYSFEQGCCGQNNIRRLT